MLTEKGKGNIMKKIRLQRKKVYSEEFKRARIKEYESGEFSIIELTKLYNIGSSTIYTWIYKYSTYNKKSLKVVEMKESGQQKVKELKNKITDLERIVGQKQIQIDYLEAIIEIASKEHSIEIKKNSNMKLLSGSGIIRK